MGVLCFSSSQCVDVCTYDFSISIHCLEAMAQKQQATENGEKRASSKPLDTGDRLAVSSIRTEPVRRIHGVHTESATAYTESVRCNDGKIADSVRTQGVSPRSARSPR